MQPRAVPDVCGSTVDLPVEEYLRPNETFSTFLLTHSSLPPETVNQLLKARLSLQVRRRPQILRLQTSNGEALSEFFAWEIIRF